MRSLSLFPLAILLCTCGRAPQENTVADVRPLAELPLIPLPREVSDERDVRYYATYVGNMIMSNDTVIADAQQYLDQRRPGLLLPLDYNLNGRLGQGGYRITFGAQQIDITGGDRAGMLNAAKTLDQVLHFVGVDHSEDVDGVYLPAGTIDDRPRYAYRGFMLDVARHFFPPDTVKMVIDRVAAYKINFLHLHLSDDQGWRIEIKSWPRLAEVGGLTEVDSTEGGYYSQEEYRELVDYARARGVTIVPEIDMPGHTNAALVAYHELNQNREDTARAYTGTRVGFSSLDTRKDLTYKFVDDVVRELAALTPGPYIHIGGDESHVTDHEDYVYFINRAQEIVRSYGKTPVGWDEMAGSELTQGAVVQFWNHPDNALAARDAGKPVLMSPATRTYLDMQYDSTARIGLHWAAYIPLDSAYLWDPAEMVPGLTDDDILGIEAPLWTETVRTLEDIDYLVFPRLLALAEVGWTPADRRDLDDFRERLEAHVEWRDYVAMP